VRRWHIVVVLALILQTLPARAGDLSIELAPDAKNPPAPQMGDNLSFHSIIRSNGPATVEGVIAWLSLVQIDPGREQPVDLEDWSAHKAVTAAALDAGETLEADWPLRLIQAGTYRVVVSAANRDGVDLATSPFEDFVVREKPVVESQRVLPVALAIPILIGIAMSWRRWNA